MPGQVTNRQGCNVRQGRALKEEKYVRMKKIERGRNSVVPKIPTTSAFRFLS